MNDMCIFGLYYHAISTIGKYEEALQNKYTCAPNLIELRAGPGIEIYMGRNMNSSAKQIQSSVSPNLIVGLSPSLTLRAFLRRLQCNKVKKCCTTAIYTHTGGLIRFYLVIWSVLSQFKWPLLFLHHRGSGRGTRLSIRSQDPNNSSDTERGPCLILVPFGLFWLLWCEFLHFLVYYCRPNLCGGVPKLTNIRYVRHWVVIF